MNPADPEPNSPSHRKASSGCGNQFSRNPKLPHEGWTWKAVVDIRDPEEVTPPQYGVCEFCGHQEIRFFHVLEHPHYPRPIRVGGGCAERLSGDPHTPLKKEKELEELNARRQRFMQHKWRRARTGHFWTRVDEVSYVLVEQPDGRCQVLINSHPDSHLDDNVRKAQLRVFELVEARRRSRATNQQNSSSQG